MNLVLTGRVLPDRARESAVAALAKLMRIPDVYAAELLAGRETVIKRGLQEAEAGLYLGALRAIGVEARLDEAVETLKCPACGAEQPKRTLCRQCGADMPRLIAARSMAAAQAKAAPAPPPGLQATLAPAAPERPRLLTFYKHSLLVEALAFLVLTPWWGMCAMLDPERGKVVRTFGTVVWLAWIAGVFGAFDRLPFLTQDPEQLAVNEAIAYGARVVERVNEYALANHTLPQRTASIELPGSLPNTVKAVAIGPEGRIRITLGDGLKTAVGGVIVLTPRVADGVIDWSCSAEQVPARYLGAGCR